MLHNLKKRSEGFTIIEVLIVLAIAALIMLIVFLAVPALQRNSRNNQRNNEAARIAAAVTECLSNRNGQIASCDDQADLDDFVDLTTLGQLSTINNTETYATTAAGVVFGRVCSTDGTDSVTTGATTRSFTVTFNLEPSVPRCIAS